MPINYYSKIIRCVINDVTAFRALDRMVSIGNVYQNTGSRPIMVMVALHVVTDADVGDQVKAFALIGSTSPGMVDVGEQGVNTNWGRTDRLCAMSFMVPSRWYYRVTGDADPGCSVSIHSWVEAHL